MLKIDTNSSAQCSNNSDFIQRKLKKKVQLQFSLVFETIKIYNNPRFIERSCIIRSDNKDTFEKEVLFVVIIHMRTDF